MKKVDSTRDLPKWFDLKNYEKLSKLSIKEIKTQLEFRNYFFDDDFLGSIYKAPYLNKIESGEVIIDENINSTVHANIKAEPLGYFPHTSSIQGVASIEAIEHTEGLINSKLYNLNQKEDDWKPYVFGDMNYNHNEFKLGSSLEYVSVNIYLTEHTNKEILADIEKLLPLWREQMDIPEPEGIIYAKALDFAKVIAYRIIPLLDLMIWEKLNDTKIPLKVMAVALFPYGEKGENELQQSIIPLAMKMTSINYRQV